VFLRIVEAYEVLIDPERRSAFEARLGRSRPTPTPRTLPVTPEPAVPEAAILEPPPPPPNDPEDDSRLAARILGEAKQLMAEEKYWDAIQSLDGGLELAKGTKINHAIRVLLARATAKNPKWQKRAETILLSVIEEDPACVEAHFVLGTIYGAAGMKSRAVAEFQRVLELHPKHPRAATELQSLKQTADQPRRF
jgi:tetratricopeptide (TPR) repeat protein